ncbi:TetR/AcrR family transcriptional regulator [Antrihabitans cavernicola]|uniref:TetR/AcrR family transcriptional regulator n=1 Tax=Antrihabitans cavernicola TaxID=2495913 RepID=A0A5A7SEV9_9NOCA|nr:TetR/AcrR family transcriptional regulator [Spelaeibacter cavernicola]KAA0024638.1 TetR/AcrR family transcriptional regulator [Spelaeibacter cavernicola]
MATDEAEQATGRRRAETRQRLLDAAFSVFAAKSFGRTRIDDVCAAAGYTKGAFYSNFSSLEELFFELYRQRSQQAAELTLRVLANLTDDVDAAIAEWGNGLAIDRDWLLINTDFVLHAARHPEVAADLAYERTLLREATATWLADYIGKNIDTLPAALPTPDDLARAVMTVYDGAIYQLLLDLDADAVRTRFIGIVTALTGASTTDSGVHFLR